MKASKNLFVRLSRSIGSLMLVFILSNTLLVEETKAQCPPGYDLTTVAMTIGICDYFVDVCVNCAIPPTGVPEHYVSIRSIRVQDNACANNIEFNDVVKEIQEKLKTPYFYYILCIYPIPPCDFNITYHKVKIATPICWQITKLDNTMVYQPCDESAECEVVYLVCKDMDIMENRYEYVSHEINGSINCYVHFPNNIDAYNIFNRLNEGESSSCFFIPTRCY